MITHKILCDFLRRRRYPITLPLSPLRRITLTLNNLDHSRIQPSPLFCHSSTHRRTEKLQAATKRALAEVLRIHSRR